MEEECCKSIVLSGGNVSASRILGDRNGEYLRQALDANNKSFYVLLNSSTNSSIAFGNNGKGWRLYNGIERNPNAAGSGLINFGCSESCPTNCNSSKFKFWNRNIEDFDLDPSLTLECTSTGSESAHLGVEWIIVIILGIVILVVFVVTSVAIKYRQHRQQSVNQTVVPGANDPNSHNTPLIVDTSPHLPMQSRSKTINDKNDENEGRLLEGISVEDVKNGSKFKCVNATMNQILWLDHDATITHMPSFLEGSHLFQMPHHIYKDSSSFFIKGKGGEDLIICTSADNTRGWFSKTLESAPNFFNKRKEKLRTSDGDLLIFEKKNFRFVSLPPIETDILVFAVFIKSD